MSFGASGTRIHQNQGLRKGEGLEERNGTVGGEEEIVTQHNLLTRDGRSFFRDSIYNLESLDMQDALGGMSSSQRERPTVKTVNQKKNNESEVQKKKMKSLRGLMLDL